MSKSRMVGEGEPESLRSARDAAAERIRARTDEILHLWCDQARREVPAGEAQPAPALLDHLPQFLSELAEALAGRSEPGAACDPPALCRKHGEQRANLAGYTVEQVHHEYRVLRRVLFQVLERDGPLSREVRDFLLEALEEASGEAVREFVRTRCGELQQSEARYHSLVESVRDYAIFSLDPDGRIVTWNWGAERITGYLAEEVLGQDGALLFTPEDRERRAPEAELQTARREGRALDERWHRRKDGSRFFASGVVTPISAQGSDGFVKVLRDITGQKQTELRRSVQLQVTRILGESAALQEATPRILADISRITGWGCGVLWTVDAGSGVLRPVSSYSAPAERCPRFDAATRGVTLRPGEGLPGTVWDSGKPLWVPDVLQAENFPRLVAARAEGLHSAVAFPVLIGERVVGVFEFFSREMREPDEDLLGTLGALGSQVGQFIERKRAEAALEQSEARKSGILEAALDAIITINHEDRILEFNPAAEQMFGYPAKEALGRRLADRIIPERLRDAHLQGMARYLATGEGPVLGKRLELSAVRSDGTEFPVELAITPIRTDGPPLFTAYLRDVTERQRMEAALREEAQLGALGTEIAEILTGSGDLGEALQGCCEALVEHLGTAFTRIWTLDEREWMLQLQASAGRYTHLDGPHSRIAVGELKIGRIARERAPHLTNDVQNDPWISDPDWARREGMVAFAGYPLLVEDRLVGVVATFSTQPLSDRTLETLASVAEGIAQFIERKRLEQFLLIRTEELITADQRKDEFLATLAHELRNPLAPIRNAVEVLRLCGGDEPTLRRARETIERQVRQMSHLVDDLLDVARITRGKIELRKEPIDLGTVVAHAVLTVRPLIDRRGQHLSVSVPLEPVHLEGDATRLEQVVTNLLTNASKFTPAQGHVWVTAECEQGKAVVRVRDTGKGIPPEMLPRIWDLFTQVHPSIDRAEGGLGLGLTLVKTLVEMHGGSVEAHSAGLGKASEFIIRLPSLPVQRPEVQPARAETVLSSGAGVRVLVVDDNVDAAETLADLLPLWGHEVRLAHDGPAAMRAAEEFQPEVVLLDIGLPGMDGYEVARRLRQLHLNGSLLLVALTGFGQPEDRRQTTAAGFDHHLVKPVNPEELERVLASAAERPSGGK